MSGKIEWQKYRGTEILLNDRSNLRTDDIIENVKQSIEFVKKSGKTDILYLVDNSNTIITPEVRDFIKQAAKDLDPFIKKSAVIGVNRAQSIMLNILNTITKMSIKAFDDIDRAKEWLIKK
ncbi:MAG: STAS/SEC14 domain-containing protein [Chlorobi bacterium]|nr:STAS/SEC14 domain-containing protein [Chlorobiota bacterium]